jgi:DNA-binding beta-propeller fold protein YncE
MIATGFLALVPAPPGHAEEAVATGQTITPEAAPGGIFQPLNPDLPEAPNFLAGQAAAIALSPDGRTLLILTSGYNRVYGADGAPVPSQSGEYVFVYDVARPTPAKRQVIRIENSYLGLAWNPDGARFYVSGGVDDKVLEFAAGPQGYAQARSFALGHKAGLGLAAKPQAAGLAVSPSGTRLLVTNHQNDSVSLIDLASGQVRDLDLRPGGGKPGGAFPRAVAWTSDTRAFVAIQRDREIVALKIYRDTLSATGRLRTRGQPVALLSNRQGTRLYAALDNTDAAIAIDPRAMRIIEEVPTAAPRGLIGDIGRLGGAGSNALALSPDERTLLVSNGGENAVAVVSLDAPARGAKAERAARHDDDDATESRPRSGVVGLIPTGWYPTGVAMRPDGKFIYVINSKSNAGPNLGACRASLSLDEAAAHACAAANAYVWQLEKAGFLAAPTPTPAVLGALTRQVARNNRFSAARDDHEVESVMAFLHANIRHVIYVVKENRTYDQLLGDLEVGDGDPRLALFGRSITPNQHALARDFVDFDNFLDSGESSNTGWNWTTAARTNDFTEREAPVNYAERGLQYDQEGTNRNLNMALPSLSARRAANPATPNDPDILPGTADVAAPDGPGGAAGAGYIWDAALRAHLSIRNWGFYGDLARYAPELGPLQIPLDRQPWKSGRRVFFPTNHSLLDVSDPYFRGFDQAFPDYWRVQEWAREFDGFEAAGAAPALMLVRLPHDHTGDFKRAIDGVDTVETEVADNDYALGLLVEKVARSRFAKDTLIFVVEDDAQDGPDHVDAHRSVAFIVGPYVRSRAVVSRRYTTVSLVRTIGAVLGLPPLGLNDAMAAPMAEAFDVNAAASWSFHARVPPVLRTTRLPLPATTASACRVQPGHDAGYWAAAMAGQDFRGEDRLDTGAYNLALWRGLRGRAPYPARRDGADLRQGRAAKLPPADRCAD